ncbi:MAG: hypothetical protein NC132_02620 [Corallococcus sp.]|nr:hypothetical protein [Corallococcus sp.]MCM1359002.1 hypothetical protein [Corallococcus sp.]MCM1394991.1 hypothetical protein [Corallococcus sp.]
MYCKRILILQQTDPRFAERGKELCGMVKLVNNTQTDVTVFVTNAVTQTFGEWWLLLNFDGEIYARNLVTLNNDTFFYPLQNLENLGCLLVKKEDACCEVACAQYGRKNLCAVLRRNAATLIAQNAAATPYEQFVASTQNFYDGVDIEKLKLQANSHYKSVAEYSSAFERYYAGGADADYYKSVQKEITKVFLDFPPYYPLIKKYPQSFFVRIDFPSSEKYFVLGVLQQQQKVRYICYGLPVEKEGFSDKDFVFVDNDPTSFWMLFQDAATGQITTLSQAV